MQDASGKTIKVLFLCSGNSCRSQMAEAFLRHLGGNSMEVYSAGLYPKPIHPLTVEVMSEKGYDMSEHRSKDLAEYLGRQTFNYVIIVCEKAHAACPTIFPNAMNLLYWPFDDPATAEGDDAVFRAKFREVRDQIEQRLITWLEEQKAELLPTEGDA